MPKLSPELREHARRKLWSMADAAATLSISRMHLYEMVNTGQIATVKIGRRRFVTDAELERYVASLEVKP